MNRGSRPLLGVIPMDIVDVDHVLLVVVRLFDRADDEEGGDEGEEYHAPRSKLDVHHGYVLMLKLWKKKRTYVLVEVRRSDTVHAKGSCTTGALHGLVQTGETGECEGVVGQRRHDPVHEGLVACIAEVVCVAVSESPKLLNQS